MLLRKLMSAKKMDAEGFRARTQGSWEMIGVVSALFLTMDRWLKSEGQKVVGVLVEDLVGLDLVVDDIEWLTLDLTWQDLG